MSYEDYLNVSLKDRKRMLEFMRAQKGIEEERIEEAKRNNNNNYG